MSFRFAHRNLRFIIVLAVVATLLTLLRTPSTALMSSNTTLDTGASARARAGTPPIGELRIIAVTGHEVHLMWSIPTATEVPSHYLIGRNGQALVSVSGKTVTYIDSNVQPGNFYTYTVTAVDGVGHALAPVVSARAITPFFTGPVDNSPPSEPEDLTVTAFPGFVLLDWYGANDNTDITAYLIKRDGKPLTLVDAGTLEYRDTTVRTNTSYTYTVEGIDTVGLHSVIKEDDVQRIRTAQWQSIFLPSISQEINEGSQTVASAASTASYSASLRRYPYLSDLVGPYVTINWATTNTSTTGSVTYGQVGSESCTAHTVAATKASIVVNSVTEYQWKAMLTLTPDTQYCYRIFLGSGTSTDLLGSDPSPVFWTQIPTGSNKPFTFIVLGDWGDVDNGGVDQANLMPLVAQSGALFGFTTGDNGYPSGNQTNYGDLVQTGTSVSGIFGPQGWAMPGRSIAMFPALGNHGMSNSDSAGHPHLLNWPQAMAALTSSGRYTRETYSGIDGTTPTTYPSAWYAFDAGIARFYVLDAAWGDTNTGTASSVYQADYDYHWTPDSAEYQWLVNDLATHPATLKFAFFHYPFYSDNKSEPSNPYLQGVNNLEGLLNNNGVSIIFNGHAHLYQRNVASGHTSYALGATGVKLQYMDGGCSSVDAFALGWSPTNSKGYKCGAATVPTSMQQVYDFVKVTVNGTTVTVSPINELGQIFDQQTFSFSGGGNPTPTPTTTSTVPTPTPTPTSAPGSNTVLVAKGSTWRYLDNGTDQGTIWRSTSFNDTVWASGPTPLGYGDPMSTTVNGGPSGARYITTYFRKTFSITDPSLYSSLTLQLRRDDGAVIYLNGVEVARSNMPAGTLTYQTLASTTVDGANETAFFTYTLPASALIAGNNTLAVEIHQVATSSSDISFNLEFDATSNAGNPTPTPADTPIATSTATSTPVNTPTSTPVDAPTRTSTATPAPTNTSTPTSMWTSVPSTSTLTPAATATSTPTLTPTPTSTSTPVSTSTSVPSTSTSTPGGNQASSGVAYRWNANTVANSNANRSAEVRINDGNSGVTVNLNGTGDDIANAWEAAGVVWPSGHSLTSVKFYNGAADNTNNADANGEFSANVKMQYTTDGVTWTDSTWPIAPVYVGNNISSTSKWYTFTGTLVNIRGVRVVGQVHTSSLFSWHVYVNEIEAY